MKLQDFRDIHAGENLLCLGTGPSLLDVPVSFLRSMPSIGINYLPYYNDLLDGFVPTYWVALDSTPVAKLLNLIPDEVVRFVPQRQEKRLKAAGVSVNNAVWFEAAAMPRPAGLGYSTTMTAAVQIALYMGASNVLLAGFDCTKGNKSDALPELGKTGTQHFYDPDNGRQYSPGWDKNVGQLASWAEAMGRGVWNLSSFTMATMVPRSDYREWTSETTD